MEEFSIKMSRPKFWKNFLLFGFFSILFSAIPISKIYKGEGDLLMVFISFSGVILMLTLTLLTLRSWSFRNSIVKISNGYLIHHANHKFKKTPISLDDISEIEISNVGRVKQIVLNLSPDPKGNDFSIKGLKKQLKGEVVYITDSLIATDEFDKLINYLISNIAS